MTITAPFTLVRSNKNRGGGDDDFDLRDSERVIGRIVRHPQAPRESPWFWVITAEGRKHRSRIADMRLLAKMRLCNLRRNGYATTSFAAASSIYRHRMSRHL